MTERAIDLAALDGDGPLDGGALARAGAGAPADLAAVLGLAARSLADDPGLVGRVLARLVPALDALGGAPLRPQATYLLAQARVSDGDLPAALALIDEARLGWLALGDRVQAVRTNLGRTNVLNEMGRHEEALEASAEVLSVLGHPLDDLPDDARRHLCAVAHMNVGVCHEYAGRFPSALAAFSAAEAEFAAVADDAGRAEVLHNRAWVLMAMGNVTEATDLLQAAAAAFGAQGLRARWAVTLVGVARAHVEMGDHADALAVLDEAREILAEIDAPHPRIDHAAATAEAYASLTLLREAVDAYRDIHKWLEGTEFALERARAAFGLGVALGRLGDSEADVELDRAVAGFEAIGHPGWVARSLVAAASLRARRGDEAGARHQLDRAAATAAAGGAPLEELRARVLRASVSGADGTVWEPLHATASALGVGPLLQLTAQASGRHLLDAGDIAGARHRLELAASLLERQRASLDHEALLVGLGVDAAALARDLVRVELADPAGTPASALAVAERAKSRSLAELAQGAVRRGSRVDDQRADLERDLHAAYRQMFEVAGDQQAFDRARRRAATLEAQVGRRHLDARTVGPVVSGADPPSPTVADPTTARAGAVTVAYADAGVELVAFVDHGDGVETVRLGVTADEVRVLLERLDAQHARRHLGPEFARRHGARLLQATRTVLGQLHAALLAPVEAVLTPRTDGAPLVISPDGPLHGVPFHALWDGERHTIERHSVSVTPSLGLFAQSGARRRDPSRGRAVVVGVADALAPCAMAEAAAVAALVPSGAGPVALLRGEAATAAAVTSAVDGAALVHIASHAWHRADNPMYSAVRLADRWWTAAEVLASANLDGATVVLSACETGRVTTGGAELLGFARGFLGAGASTLVASLWAADDAVTAELMATFHRWLPRLGPADALRTAQLEAMQHHEHPNLWAPFVVVGAR